MRRPAKPIIREPDRPKIQPVTNADAPQCAVCGTIIGSMYRDGAGKLWRCAQHREAA